MPERKHCTVLGRCTAQKPPVFAPDERLTRLNRESCACGGVMRLVKSILACLAIAFAMPASATTITLDAIDYNYSPVYGGISYVPGGFAAQVGPAGQFSFGGHNAATNDPFSALTWCIDIFTDVRGPDYASGNDLDFNIVSLADVFDSSAKISQLSGLVSHAGSVISSAGTLDAQRNAAAAFQLAIWEIIYEKGSSGYSISNGDFFTFDGDLPEHHFSQIADQTNAYLINIADGGIWSTPISSVSILQSATGGNQSQIFAAPAPAVPEPGTWMTMILGFGFAGAMVRRSRKTSARAALSA